MVSQSNAAGSSGRRCRPNTPKAKPVSRSKKTKRYPGSLVPEAERHFWLDEVEDPKVTRLVDHIRSVHTFRTEDFEGGDMSFGKDNAIPEGKPQGVPLIQRTLRPRKRVAVVIEDLTTPEHNEPDVPPESGRSPNEDLKSWILEQFQNFKNGIYERLDQFEKTLCDHFGVPLPNIHNKGKRKVGEDDHGYSGSPKSVENQYKKQRPNRKSRKINSTVPKPGQEMHSYPLRSTDVLEGTIGNTQPGFSRETRENNENSTLLTLQFNQNATDQPRTPNAVPDESQTPNPLTTLTIYRGLFFARPQAYVSPAKKDDTHIGEKAVDVKWDEANPHAYSAVKETNYPIFKKFSDILSENVEQQFAIKTNHIVTNSFFLDIATPGNSLSDEVLYLFSPPTIKRLSTLIYFCKILKQHMHVIMQMLWRRRGSVLQKNRRVICDPYFTKIITSKWSAFSEAKDKLHFDWGTNIASYVTGMCRGKNLKLQLGRDIDVVYAPIFWQDKHWVGLSINLQTSNVTIFDSFITANPTETHVDAHMTPILKSLPYILEQYVGFTDYLIKEGERTYAWNRFQGIYHNNRGGDCGPCAAKFMEMHSNGDGKEEMSRITDKVVDKCREQYAMDCYEEFVGDFQVANEAGVK
ncbi:unnamed protein product [Brassica oleracea]